MLKKIYILLLLSFFLFSCWTKKDITIVNNTWSLLSSELDQINIQKTSKNGLLSTWSINKKVVTISEDSKDINLVIDLIKDKKLSKAEKKLLELYNKDNKNTLVLWNLWNLYIQMSDFHKAEKYLLESNKIEKWKNINTLLNLSVVYINLWNKQKGQEFIDKCLFIDPNNKMVKDFQSKSIR